MLGGFPGWSETSDVGSRDHPHDRPHRRLEREGPVLGRAEAARRLEEAHKLLEEIADLLTEMRKTLLGVLWQ